MIRLPYEVQPLFVEWLESRYPTKAAHVLSRLRSMRGGTLNDPRFGERHVGQGEFAKLLERRFLVATKRLGLNRDRVELDTSLFDPPGSQGKLFG